MMLLIANLLLFVSILLSFVAGYKAEDEMKRKGYESFYPKVRSKEVEDYRKIVVGHFALQFICFMLLSFGTPFAFNTLLYILAFILFATILPRLLGKPISNMYDNLSYFIFKIESPTLGFAGIFALLSFALGTILKTYY